jgi:hypothetical protein
MAWAYLPKPILGIDTSYSLTTNKSNFKSNYNLNKPLAFLQSVEVSGYYRFFGNFRKLKEAYPHLKNNKTNIFLGDDSQIPQLMLNINGHVSSTTEFGTDLFMWTPWLGQGEKENVKGLNLGVNLYGNFSTSLGNFEVRTGGINWYSLSPFTFQTAKGNNRYSLFDRNPWDPSTRIIDARYSEFYSLGAVNQDQRWGNQAFQGFIFEGTQLPHDFSFNFMYGKTQFDGGLSPIPNTSYGGRIKKASSKNKNFVALNSFNNTSYLDSLQKSTVGFNISSIEFIQYIKKLKIYGEFATGRSFTAANKNNWGEALSLKIAYPIANRFITELHCFRISPNVFNNSSVFINSSIQASSELKPGEIRAILIPVSSALLPIGQLSNNRQGVELNTTIDIGPLKNSIGYGNSTEIENLSSQLTYGHAFNNLALSRFWRWSFPSNVGPYNNLNKIYRAVYETVNLTDIDTAGLPLKKKYFNTFEISSKYKASLLDKDLFLFYLGSFNSVQNFLSPFVNFSEKSLLRAYYHQLETYYTLNSKLVWCNYVGFERIIANYSTQTDVESKRPKNQTGISYATGFDIKLSKGAGLYLRQRWMNYKDSSFAKDKYNGYETSVELNIVF